MQPKNIPILMPPQKMYTKFLLLKSKLAVAAASRPSGTKRTKRKAEKGTAKNKMVIIAPKVNLTFTCLTVCFFITQPTPSSNFPHLTTKEAQNQANQGGENNDH